MSVTTEKRPPAKRAAPKRAPAKQAATRAPSKRVGVASPPAGSANKVKVSLTLDADIVAVFEAEGPLSAQINDALREEADHRLHQVALRELLAKFEAEEGPLTAEDEVEVRRFMEMLS